MTNGRFYNGWTLTIKLIVWKNLMLFTGNRLNYPFAKNLLNNQLRILKYE